MRCLVTGAAGFIGSHLSEELIRKGHTVRGIDAFIPYYPRAVKETNLRDLRMMPNFAFHEVDLRTDDMHTVTADVDVIFHLAAMPGLVRSWSDFNLYASCNIEGTQRLLEAARTNGVQHFIYGSTSSVYGRMATSTEDAVLRPFSPYGVTKLGAEHLCQAYADNFGLPLTILRLFSVYGPRQRPDMAYHVFIRALLRGEAITIYGDGEQTRTNTYVADCVRGIMLASERREQSVGQVFNIGGGEVVSLNQVLETLATLTGTTPHTVFAPTRHGDQRQTAADTRKARALLGYSPATAVIDGLRAQLTWQQSQ